MKAVLLVLTNPGSPEMESVYNDWYTNEHVPDVLNVPGYVGATRYLAYPSWTSIPQRYLTIYDLEVDDVAHIQRISDEHMRRIGSGEMRRSPDGAMDRESMRAMYYIEVEPAQHSKVTPTQTPNSVFVTYNQPKTPDLADEYNRWYRDQHLPDVLACPGFTRAQRFRSTGIEMVSGPWFTHLEYVNIYEHTATNVDDYNAAFAVVRDRIAKGEIPMTDTLTPGAPTSVYERISEPQFAKH